MVMETKKGESENQSLWWLIKPGEYWEKNKLFKVVRFTNSQDPVYISIIIVKKISLHIVCQQDYKC